MDKKIILYLLMAAFSLPSIDAFDPEKWETNAKSYAYGIIDEITSFAWDRSNDNCIAVTVILVTQEINKLMAKFLECNRDEYCYFIYERDFHQALENIRAESNLCVSPICDEMFIKNDTEDFYQLCLNDEDRSEVAGAATNCTYLALVAKTLAHGVQADDEIGAKKIDRNLFGKPSCNIVAQIKAKEIRSKAVDQFRKCQKIMLEDLSQQFNKTITCYPNDIRKAQKEMIKTCSSQARIDYRESMKEVNEKIVECYR